MLLDLFITHWTEPWEVGKKNFDMLALQRLVDWSEVRITLVHDGTEAFPTEYFDGYPFKVKQVMIPHGGIAKARNWCIDHSTATWIKWNDFDDMFANAYSLVNLTAALKGSQAFDMLWFEFCMEADGQRVKRDWRDPVLIHGKAFRREFLLEKKLRFPEFLTWCEDSAFLALVEMDIDHRRIGRIMTEGPLYIYIKRDGSLCNRPEIEFANRKAFFARHRFVEDEMRKRGYIREANMMMLRAMGDSYVTMKIRSCIVTQEEKEAHEREIWAYYKGQEALFKAIGESDFEETLGYVNKENQTEVTGEQLLGWIHGLKQKYEDGEKNVSL